MKLFSQYDIICMFDITSDNSSVANVLSYFKNDGRLLIQSANDIKTGIIVDIGGQNFLYLCGRGVKTFKKELINQGFIFI